MRAKIEKLKESRSVFGRMVYAGCRFVSLILPATRRDEIVVWMKRKIRYCPAYARRVRGSGVSTEKRTPQVIVSLTSYPARITTVHRVIIALLNQTFKPDKVILWLGEDKFPQREAELPQKILCLREHGLTIGWCKDLRSYTKLIPSLRAYPEDIIVTADDDIYYGPEWLDRLYASYQHMPQCIHSNVVRVIPKCQDGNFGLYSTWEDNSTPRHVSPSNFLLGYGGVLYPPHCLDEEVFNAEKFQALAPFADDIWFWAMAVKRGTYVCVVPEPILPKWDIYANQTDALSRVNVAGPGLNDSQFSAVVAHYGLINRLGVSEQSL